MSRESIFITGGTGYIGKRLILRLLEGSYTVRALARPGSEKKVPDGCRAVSGNALDAATFAKQIAPAQTFVQLAGVPHPSPAKAEQFRRIDLVSVRESVKAAREAGVNHFIYVSVAHPAPMMKAYIEVRQEGERLLRESGMNGTILRPWYVLGPGHRWPYALIPFYKVCELLPGTRESARRLGLVTVKQMVEALCAAVEKRPEGIRTWGVPEIREAGSRKERVSAEADRS